MPLQESRRLLAIAAAEAKIQTAVRPIVGGAFIAVSPDLWNSERINSWFEFCQMNLDDPYSYNPRGTHWIFVTRDSLQTCICSIQNPPGSRALEISSDSLNVTPLAKKRGRKPDVSAAVRTLSCA